MCGTYKKQGKSKCTIHKVKDKDLVEIIQEDLRKFTAQMSDVTRAKLEIEEKLKSKNRQYEKQMFKTEKKLVTLQERKGKLVLRFVDETIPKAAYDAAVQVIDNDIMITEIQLNNLKESNNLQTEQEKLLRVHK